MNVLVVIWSIRIGGAETFAADLCRYLKSKGHTPYLFPVLGPWDRAYYDSLSKSGIVVLSPFRNKLIDWFFWKCNALISRLSSFDIRDYITRLYFKRSIKKQKIQAIVSNAIVADVFVWKNNRSDIPYIVVEHGEYSYCVCDNSPVSIDALAAASDVVSVSRWCQNKLQQSWGISSTVIYNAQYQPCIQEITKKNNQPFVFCMLGRGIQYKGWEEAIEAFLRVKEVSGNCKLILIGAGEHLDLLKKKYENTSGIEFKGRLTNPRPVLQSAHVGLVPSRKYEAFGIVILEFFSLGLPVIASSVGAIPEVVNYNGRSGGTLVAVDDNGRVKVDLFAQAMITLMQNHNLYEQASKDAREIQRAFSFENTGKLYEEILLKYKG